MNILNTAILFIFLGYFSSRAQSPYEVDWLTDSGITAVALGGTYFGFKEIKSKPFITTTELNSLNPENIPFYDRWAVGNYSEKAEKVSDYPFYASFALPIIFSLDNNQRSHAADIYGMYVQSMAITGALYSLSAGLITRYRPLTYNKSLPFEKRTHSKNTRSFFGGHVAATATATFFTAKIYNDFNPNGGYTDIVWVGAVAIPLFVAYLRTKAGKHFLSDNVVGFLVGMTSGILVPELHKITSSNESQNPEIKGIQRPFSIGYSFSF
ncbi:hypothetical protein GCM10009117_22910 [Gangjinia marincola]|uniref:Phosphatidic acid phosphatase type 2/haloperoxidase domain-containing protein n=1 Tax=Gangjinia marincola TaxID=578463 RepID=A0ABP3XZ60_9FLAO